MTSNLEEEWFAREDAEKLHKLHVEKEKHDKVVLEKALKDPRFAGVLWARNWLGENGATIKGAQADQEMYKAFLKEHEE